MLTDRESVDHRDRGLGRELDDDLVRPGPRDERVHEPVQVAGDVTDTLAGAEHRVVGEIDRVPAELAHAGLERHARPQARTLEEQGDRPPAEWFGRVPPRLAVLGFEGRGRVEETKDFRDGQVGDAQEVTALE